MKLSTRMEAVAAMVSPCKILADIGTDHAHVPIALVERGIADAAIAMDVREGPLARARENIAAAGMTDRIRVRLSDGTAALAPGEADAILIAGMGGALMRRILRDGREAAHAARELVLQPQSEIADFRLFLWNEGYRIPDENMVYEDGKYYTVIKAVWIKEPEEKESAMINALSDLRREWPTGDEMPDTEDALFAMAEYGSHLLMRRNPVLSEYLQMEQRQLQKILESLPQDNAMSKQTASDARIVQRRAELGRKLRRNLLAQQFYSEAD